MFFTKDKLTAFLIHLLISATVVGAVIFLIFFFWYPRPYFEANGAWTVLRILIMVDLVLGPLLTLVLFRKGKPGLVMDMSIVAAIQLTALIYGVYVIYGERPYYLAFAVDRFEVIGKVEVDANKIKYPELKVKPNIGPILVFADFPKDKEERSQFVFETVLEGKPDLERRPEYYHPYLLNKDKVINKAKPLSELIGDNNSYKRKIEQFLENRKGDQDDYLYLPLVGKNNDLALVIDKTTGLPIDGISIDPW
jgi:hypothetical protein